MADSPLGEAALWYTQLRVPVFPCRPREKIPLTRHGFKDASADQDTIRRWWTEHPEANIAVPTGPSSGWLVLDIDPRAGGDQTVEALITKYGRWPDTAEAMTGGGGRHVVFRHVGGLRSGRIGEGLDLKTTGGYIVVAPSLHPSGTLYSWDGIEGKDALKHLAEPPGWLLRLAREGTNSNGSKPADEKIARGQRNQTLASLAGSMRRRGMASDEIATALLAVNDRRCDPPLPEADVRRIAGSVANYQPRIGAGDPAAERHFEALDDGRCRLHVPGIAAVM